MSKSKKKRNKDRISLLPDCLLHHILSFLDTLQVVKTCVLSKRWKSVWTCIPTLNFDFTSYTFQGSTENPEIKVRSFDLFVLRFLSKHRASHVIRLKYYGGTMDCDDEKFLLEFLICYGARRMVQELDIDTDNQIHFDWIRCLSACQSLNSLRIFCMFAAEWGLLMLPHLRTLEIGNSCSEHGLNFTEKMFSGCPNLESLVLVNLFCQGRATICAPKLQHFNYCCPLDLELICKDIELCSPNLRRVIFGFVIPTVKSTSDFPCLDKLHIVVVPGTGSSGSASINEFGQELAHLLRVFRNARSISMPLAAIKALLSVPSSVTANLSFDNLRHLKLIALKASNKIKLPMNKLPYLLKCSTLETVLVQPT